MLVLVEGNRASEQDGLGDPVALASHHDEQHRTWPGPQEEAISVTWTSGKEERLSRESCRVRSRKTEDRGPGAVCGDEFGPPPCEEY